MQCEWCGRQFTRKRKSRDSCRYCTKRCYFDAVRAGAQKFKGRVRGAWGAFVDWAHAWDKQRPATVGRSKAYKPRPLCEVCGKETNHRHGRFCSYACLKSWRGNRQCELCGAVVPNASAYSKCRCDRCKIQSKKETNRRGKKKYGRNHRQRARHHGVRYVSVEVRAIYERDGWRCQICKRQCRQSFAVSKVDGRPHPRSPTIDHIKSMKDGGNHEPSNLQLACFGCNTKKGAASRGQLRLALA